MEPSICPIAAALVYTYKKSALDGHHVALAEYDFCTDKIKLHQPFPTSATKENEVMKKLRQQYKDFQEPMPISIFCRGFGTDGDRQRVCVSTDQELKGKVHNPLPFCWRLPM